MLITRRSRVLRLSLYLSHPLRERARKPQILIRKEGTMFTLIAFTALLLVFCVSELFEAPVAS